MEFDWAARTRITSPAMASWLRESEEAYRNGPMVIEHQRRKHERRRLCLGETSKGRLLTFVVTERKGKIRFVTAFPMHPRQREIYREEE